MPRSSPHPPGRPGPSGFLLLLSGALGRGTKPHVGHSCPKRGKGLRRNRFTPPTPPQARCPGLSASLGTKQSLLSNFKCYLRTAWPQPKAALWKLVFRCRGCKYQRHTFGGGGCFDASPHSVAGAGPEWTHRRTEARTDRGTHTSFCGLHTRHTTAVDHSPCHHAQNLHILTHQEAGGVHRGLPPAHRAWDFSSCEVSPNPKSSILRSPGRKLVLGQVPSPHSASVSPAVKGRGGPGW